MQAPKSIFDLQKAYLQADASSLFAQNSKSFYLAGLIFNKTMFARVAKLYRLCRFIDDCADKLAPTEAQLAIQELKDDLVDPRRPSIFNGLVSEQESWGVPRSAFKELILGAESDAKEEQILSRTDLSLYCYRVAGVVGLMMCPLIGVKNKNAYAHAIDLGIAMQMTNICRDILEDAQMNRTYLPMQDLYKTHLTKEVLATKGSTPPALKSLVKDMLQTADQFYESAYNGLAYIPFRPRLCILVAGEVYRAIGKKLQNNNLEVLQGRTVLSLGQKTWVILGTLKKLVSPQFWKVHTHNSQLHTGLKKLPGAYP